MQHLYIARSLRLALVAMTLALGLVAALGIASLYNARQRYETRLTNTSSLATAGANLASAGIAEEEVLRDARGPSAAAARRQVAAAFNRAAATAASLARSDPTSHRLVQQQVAAERTARTLAVRGSFSTALSGPLAQARRLAAELQARQAALQNQARRQARADSGRALLLVIVAVVLALGGALALVTVVVRAMRRPLDDLVQATHSLAEGKLEQRVEPSGPRELQDLAGAFNAMGEDLATAQHRIEEERRRLAVTIESLGDALIVTEPGSSVIATVNPRAAELVPELTAGDRIDAEAGSARDPALAGLPRCRHASVERDRDLSPAPPGRRHRRRDDRHADRGPRRQRRGRRRAGRRRPVPDQAVQPAGAAPAGRTARRAPAALSLLPDSAGP